LREDPEPEVFWEAEGCWSGDEAHDAARGSSVIESWEGAQGQLSAHAEVYEPEFFLWGFLRFLEDVFGD